MARKLEDMKKVGNNKLTQKSTNKSKFKGKCVDLKGYIFNYRDYKHARKNLSTIKKIMWYRSKNRVEISDQPHIKK